MTSPDFREQLLNGLGGAWPEPHPVRLKRRQTTERKEGYLLEAVSYEVSPEERLKGWLLIPDSATAENPAPGIAIWHQHAGQFHLGKSEPAGLAGNPMHHTGVAFAKEGYVVFCVDALCFEERQDKTGRQKGMSYERFEFLKWTVDGKCLAWKNIWDMQRAVDVLCELPEVRADRLGCYGHSMGSTHTWLVGPWEPRLKCLVANCCLPTYRGIHREHMLHCFPNFIPGIHQYGDTPDIAALIAPRRLHFNFGETDRGTPIEDVPWSMEVIEKAYQSMHAEEKLSWFIEPETGHVLSAAMWDKTKQALASELMS
ncbi:MAG: acetylxylan esterase [Planctomycetaceae bacterium]|nr:acetylxylan esterase [Planctomycetaceae bacterium]